MGTSTTSRLRPSDPQTSRQSPVHPGFFVCETYHRDLDPPLGRTSRLCCYNYDMAKVLQRSDVQFQIFGTDDRKLEILSWLPKPHKITLEDDECTGLSQYTAKGANADDHRKALRNLRARGVTEEEFVISYVMPPMRVLS